MDTLGPRILNYVSKEGVEGEIQIKLTRTAPTRVDLGDEDTLLQPTFLLQISCDWFKWQKSFPAMDELQSIFWAMRIADIYIQKICRDNDIDVFAHRPGDITADFDCFKA